MDFPGFFANKKPPWNPWQAAGPPGSPGSPAPARHPTRSDALQADVPSARWDHGSPGAMVRKSWRLSLKKWRP